MRLLVAIVCLMLFYSTTFPYWMIMKEYAPDPDLRMEFLLKGGYNTMQVPVVSISNGILVPGTGLAQSKYGMEFGLELKTEGLFTMFTLLERWKTGPINDYLSYGLEYQKNQFDFMSLQEINLDIGTGLRINFDYFSLDAGGFLGLGIPLNNSPDDFNVTLDGVRYYLDSYHCYFYKGLRIHPQINLGSPNTESHFWKLGLDCKWVVKSHELMYYRDGSKKEFHEYEFEMKGFVFDLTLTYYTGGFDK